MMCAARRELRPPPSLPISEGNAEETRDFPCRRRFQHYGERFGANWLAMERPVGHPSNPRRREIRQSSRFACAGSIYLQGDCLAQSLFRRFGDHRD